MDDGDTPDERALILARRQAERARLLDELRDADLDGDEPSEVTFRGDAALVIAKQQAGLLPRIQESLAPISRRMGSRTGKIVAVITGIVATAVAAAVRAYLEGGPPTP